MNWPPHFIVADVDAFFEAVQTAVKASTTWRLRRSDDEYDVRFLGADYIGDKFAGQRLGFAVCSFEDKPHSIQLTLHADRWPGDPILVSDADYMRAERLTASVFNEVGKLLGGRLRRSRPRKRKHLVGKLATFFRHFCVAATDNWTGSKRAIEQPELEKFYVFICAAHATASALGPDELLRALCDAGFTRDSAAKLVEHYEIGRRILQARLAYRLGRRDFWHPWDVRAENKRSRVYQAQRDARERKLAEEEYENRVQR